MSLRVAIPSFCCRIAPLRHAGAIFAPESAAPTSDSGEDLQHEPIGDPYEHAAGAPDDAPVWQAREEPSRRAEIGRVEPGTRAAPEVCRGDAECTPHRVR